jgi:hypothetical protein
MTDDSLYDPVARMEVRPSPLLGIAAVRVGAGSYEDDAMDAVERLLRHPGIGVLPGLLIEALSHQDVTWALSLIELVPEELTLGLRVAMVTAIPCAATAKIPPTSIRFELFSPGENSKAVAWLSQ